MILWLTMLMLMELLFLAKIMISGGIRLVLKRFIKILTMDKLRKDNGFNSMKPRKSRLIRKISGRYLLRHHLLTEGLVHLLKFYIKHLFTSVAHQLLYLGIQAIPISMLQNSDLPSISNLVLNSLSMKF